MGGELESLVLRLHPMLVHFPLALLVVSWALDLAARWRSGLRESGWVTLLIGAAATVPAVISGLIAHEPYEGSAFIEAIEAHERLGFATMAIFLVLTVWRWRSRRRGADVGAGWLYLGLALAGLLVLTLTGNQGGNLVYELGIGVKASQP